ncbi:MAG: hypothetical protein QXQ82_00065 [Candidatus Pacearchaeota archaeon]
MLSAKMEKVVTDTNFLIYLAKYKLFDELVALGYELLVPRAIEFELEKIANNKEKKLKDREAALLARQIIKKWVELKKAKYVDINNEKAIDDAILEFAKKRKAMVATMDVALRKALKKEGIKILILRQKKYFVVE